MSLTSTSPLPTPTDAPSTSTSLPTLPSTLTIDLEQNRNKLSPSIFPTRILTFHIHAHNNATTTSTRPYHIAVPTPSAHPHPHWPHIGSVPAESDIPLEWRNTTLAKETWQRNMVLVLLMGVFAMGVVGVLVVSWCQCWWAGDCCWTLMERGRRKGVKRRLGWSG